MTDFAVAYCVFGRGRWVREAQASVLTALRWLARAGRRGSVVVYTDSPEAFERFGVTLCEVPSARFDAWRGADDFVYRPKVKVLQRALAEWERPVLLVDSDTVFTRSPIPELEALRPGTARMDRYEGLVFRSRAHRALARQLLRAHPEGRVELRSGRSYEISPATSEMWCSGTVGLHCDDRELVDDVLELLDVTTSRATDRLLEQYAFSEILSQATRLAPTEHFVHHYWGSWVDPYYGLDRRAFSFAQLEPVVRTAETDGVDAALARLRRAPLRPFRRPLHVRVWNRLQILSGQPGL